MRLMVVTGAVLILAMAGIACGGPAESQEQSGAAESAAIDRTSADKERGARTIELPGSSSEGVPEGHPPIGGDPSTGGIPLPPEGSGSGSSGLAWTTPESWTEETPASRMRRAQFRVPGPAGDGECVVYYFGPGQGGDPRANAIRWAEQFSQPDGSSALETMKLTMLEGTGVPVQMVEVHGTYDGGMTMTAAPADPKPSYMLLGGIAEGPDAFWFFKFTGPEATVSAERETFETMMRSLRVGS